MFFNKGEEYYKNIGIESLAHGDVVRPRGGEAELVVVVLDDKFEGAEGEAHSACPVLSVFLGYLVGVG